MSDNNSIVPNFDSETDENLNITLVQNEGSQNCLSVVLDGSVDTYNSQLFQRRISKVVDAGYLNLVFNCAALNYLSSTGIGAFTAFIKMVRQDGGDIVLTQVQDKILEVFQLLGFAQFFNIMKTDKEAYAYFETRPAMIFPKIVECPTCKKKLKANKAGRFRCIDCKTIIAISKAGEVSAEAAE